MCALRQGRRRGQPVARAVGGRATNLGRPIEQRDRAVRRVVSPVLRLVRGSLPDALATARRGHAGARAPLGFPLCNAATFSLPIPV